MNVAKVDACNVCGATSPRGVMPPEVEPCRWQTATADYDLVLCQRCMLLPLPQILEHADAGPGGTVEGADRGPYMVHRDGKGPAPNR